MSCLIKNIEKKINAGEDLKADDALAVLRAPKELMAGLFYLADKIRRKYFTDSLSLCSIVNAKSGVCSQDCSFCAQSVHNPTEIVEYPLLDSAELKQHYDRAGRLPIDNFGFVTSGPSVSDKDFSQIISLFEQLDETAEICASMGDFSVKQFEKLKQAGLKRYHHNLETAPSFFSEICTTHDYSSRVETVQKAKEAGLEICSGGIIGLGETLEQRVELAITLRKLDVDSIPLNFLIPVENSPTEKSSPPEPLEILKTISMFRLVNPEKEIKICAGRIHLRDLQSMVFYAGATGIMVGDLLTVSGRSVEKDLQMLEDLGFVK